MNLLNISPLHLSRDVAKEVARGFALRNDADSFEALWEVANEARAVRKENLKSGELDREIDAAYDALEQSRAAASSKIWLHRARICMSSRFALRQSG